MISGSHSDSKLNTSSLGFIVKLVSANCGQSLIQVMISVAIVGIVAAGFASMLSQQLKSMEYTQQKLIMLDLQNIATASLSNGSVCQYVLNHPDVLTFDSTKLPQTITLPSPDSSGKPAALYTNIILGPPAQPGAPFAIVGQPASPLSPSLLVESINLEVLSGSKGVYLGQWKISFTGNKLSLKSVTVSTSLSVDDITDPTKTKIIGCQGSALGSPLLSRTISFFGPGFSHQVNIAAQKGIQNILTHPADKAIWLAACTLPNDDDNDAFVKFTNNQICLKFVCNGVLGNCGGPGGAPHLAQSAGGCAKGGAGSCPTSYGFVANCLNSIPN